MLPLTCSFCLLNLSKLVAFTGLLLPVHLAQFLRPVCKSKGIARDAKMQLEKTYILLSPPMHLCCPMPKKACQRHGKQTTVLLEVPSVSQKGWKSELRQWWPVLFPMWTCLLTCWWSTEMARQDFAHSTAAHSLPGDSWLNKNHAS